MQARAGEQRERARERERHKESEMHGRREGEREGDSKKEGKTEKAKWEDRCGKRARVNGRRQERDGRHRVCKHTRVQACDCATRGMQECST